MLNESEILVIDFEGFDYNSLIGKELSVHSKSYQETLLFKPAQVFSTISTINRDSIIFLTKRIHGIDWAVAFTLTFLSMIIWPVYEFVFPTQLFLSTDM